MKGGIVAMLYAISVLKEIGADLNGRIGCADSGGSIEALASGVSLKCWGAKSMLSG